MHWFLEGGTSDNREVRHRLEPPGPLVIGRSRDCAIRVSDARVSRHHCLLRFEEDRWWAEDLQSSNGTSLNGGKIQSAQMHEGDRLSVGGVEFLVVTTETVVPEEQKPHARPLVAASAVAPTQELSVFGGDEARGEASKRLAGRYELESAFHRGATGVFYRARDVKHDRLVCVKMLAPSFTSDGRDLDRFVRGVRTAANLHHANIVRLYRAGRTRAGQWWLAMEYVDGPSVRQVVNQYGVGNMLSPPRVLALARDIAAALQAAYEQQVLHRNIRPDNILLTSGGQAKLSDFTLMRGVVLTTLQEITTSSQIVGDLAYMAPERADPRGTVDCRSDLYALGACLYTLLAGRPPFTSTSTVAVIEKIRRDDPVPPSKYNLSVSRPLEAVVLKCLAKSPTDRFATPAALGEELDRVARFQGMAT